jgi:hypothetical protein
MNPLGGTFRCMTKSQCGSSHRHERVQENVPHPSRAGQLDEITHSESMIEMGNVLVGQQLWDWGTWHSLAGHGLHKSTLCPRLRGGHDMGRYGEQTLE